MSKQIHSKALTNRVVKPGNTDFAEITYVTGAAMIAMGYVFSSWKLAAVGSSVIAARFCVEVMHQRKAEQLARENQNVAHGLRVYRDGPRSSVR